MCTAVYQKLQHNFKIHQVLGAEPVRRGGLKSASGVPGVTCRSSLSACPGFLCRLRLGAVLAICFSYSPNVQSSSLRPQKFSLSTLNFFYSHLEKPLLAIAPLLAWCFPFSVPFCPSLYFRGFGLLRRDHRHLVVISVATCTFEVSTSCR